MWIIIAWIWTVICTGFLVWYFVWLVTDFFSAGEIAFMGVLGIVTYLLVGPLIIWLAYSADAYDKSPNLVTLKKHEWVCSASHQETTTTFVMSGKVMVPVTSIDTICDQYSRTR